MEERKYLKWYHKVGYGSGDVAGNCVYALLTAFMMIYLDRHCRTQYGHRKYLDRCLKDF